MCDKKRGTRPWNCYFVCLCPKGKHVALTENWAWAFDKEGNYRTPPTFCTECPINALQFKNFRAGDTPMHLFSKWTKTPQNYASNHGNPVLIAIEWLSAQGCNGARPYDTNAGRKSLAGWLDKTNTPYPQGFEIHGDLFDVWSDAYQPNVPYSDFGRRKQSTSARICTKALRRLAHFLGRDQVPDVPVMDLQTMLTINMLRAQGEHQLVERTVAEYERLSIQSQDDQKTQD